MEHAEILGDMVSVELVRRKNVTRVVFECDSKVAVQHLTSTYVNLSNWATLVAHFWNSVQHLNFEGLFHVSRSQNLVTDRLVAFGSSLLEPMFWFDNVFPSCIVSASLADMPN